MAVPPLHPDDALKTLRKEMRKLRQQLESQHVWIAAPLPAAVQQMFAKANILGLYAPMSGEPDPLRVPFPTETETALPALLSDGSLVFRRWKHGDPGERSPWQGQQPVQTAAIMDPDLILVPLVAFDANLNRLGQGGGHYDRYFATHPTARRVGIAWEAQQVSALPIRAWDVPLHAIVTEQSCYTKDLPNA